METKKEIWYAVVNPNYNDIITSVHEMRAGAEKMIEYLDDCTVERVRVTIDRIKS